MSSPERGDAIVLQATPLWRTALPAGRDIYLCDAVLIAERDAGVLDDFGELVRFRSNEGAQLGIGHAA